MKSMIVALLWITCSVCTVFSEYILVSGSIYDERLRMEVPMIVKLDNNTGQAWVLDMSRIDLASLPAGVTLKLIGWVDVSESLMAEIQKFVSSQVSTNEAAMAEADR